MKRPKKQPTLEDELTHSLYDIFKSNSQSVKEWEIEVCDHDQKRIKRAQRTMLPTIIHKDLSDVQLLKLHSFMFPDYDTRLVYHNDFNVYELKHKMKTKYLFTYENGKYTPINSIL